MVKSIINPIDIKYSETVKIDKDDIEVSSTIYEYSIYNIDIEIALGRPNFSFTNNHNVIFFSIYLIVDSLPIARIGIFEIINTDYIYALDESEDSIIDFSKGNIIIFENASKLNTYIQTYSDDSNDESVDDDDVIIETDDINELIKDEQYKVTRISKELPISKSISTSNNIINDKIFTIDADINVPTMLVEETESDSDYHKTNYLESVNNSWISKFAKNNNYNVIDNEGSGDCFFAIVRDAFNQIGHITTVAKLRALLAKDVTYDVFNEYKTIYNDFKGELENIKSQIKNIPKDIARLKKRINLPQITKIEHQQILDNVSILDKSYKQQLLAKHDTTTFMNEFSFMKNVDNIERFREVVLTSQFWADAWAISTIERLLNVKIIILSYESYNSGDMDAIMQCGELLDKDNVINPDYYIIASYTGKHYTLIEYKLKRIYKFKEIPFDIKSMIINKCLEKNSGPYYMIDDFKKYKTKLGFDSEYGEVDKDTSDMFNNDLYDKNTVFSFYKKSNPIPNAGKGSGETIINSNLIKYGSLNTPIKTNVGYNWRRKLDDNWTGSPFELDGHKWASVKHYLLGSQYKNGFPDYYSTFSLDSDSEISTNVDAAIEAVDNTTKSGKIKAGKLPYKPDADFYEYGINNRYESSRKNALFAKFNQNSDLNKILITTYPAKLISHVSSGKSHNVDTPLMKLRKEIMGPIL